MSIIGAPREELWIGHVKRGGVDGRIISAKAGEVVEVVGEAILR